MKATTQSCKLVRGSLITMDPAVPYAEAMAVIDGKIVAVGDLNMAQKAVPKGTPLLDIGTTPILPGLIDSHNHMLWTGMAEVLVDLSAARCIEDVVRLVKDWADAHPQASFIVGAEGWEVNDIVERRYPTRVELDNACPDRPVYLPRGGHAAAVNSLALKLAEVSTSTPDPFGGVICRDDHGEATGLLLESARNLVGVHVPAPSSMERKTALLAIQSRYLAAGITRVVEPGLKPAEIDDYLTLDASGDLTVRATLLALIEDGRQPVACAENFVELLSDKRLWSDRLKPGGFKAFLDGGGSLGTAWLRNAYPHRPDYVGERLIAQADLDALYSFALERGLPVGVHTVGGAAIDSALHSIAELHSRQSVANAGFSLIHAYLWPSKENMDAAARLGVTVAVQPTMYEQFAEQLVDQFGWDATLTASPLRSWLDSGVVVAGGSDSPITPFDPMRGIWQAVTRYSEKFGSRMNEKECVTPLAALKMYTGGAAAAAMVEEDEGILRVGAKADWVALSADPLACPPDELKDIAPLMTIVNGEVVHDAR